MSFYEVVRLRERADVLEELIDSSVDGLLSCSDGWLVSPHVHGLVLKRGFFRVSAWINGRNPDKSLMFKVWTGDKIEITDKGEYSAVDIYLLLGHLGVVNV